MLIKYCDRCTGKPYTDNLGIEKCPKCNIALRIESCEEYDLENRPELYIPESVGNTPHDDHDFSSVDNDSIPVPVPETKPEKKQKKAGSVIPFDALEKRRASSSGISSADTFIRGRVYQYSSSGKEDGSYRRLLPKKFYQALIYRQRLEDVIHRFVVKIDTGKDAAGYGDPDFVPVNVHGTIAGGLQLTDNEEVEVKGRYDKNGVLMAYDIRIVSNGHRSKVSFQHDVRAITIGIVLSILAIVICFFGSSSVVNFYEAVKTLLAAWLISFIVVTVLFLIFSISKAGIFFSLLRSEKKRKFPLLTLLIISFAIAFFAARLMGM